MPMTGLPFEASRASPRTAVIVPRVMMKGGSSPTATPTPLMRPTPSPASSAAPSASTRGLLPCPSMAARMPENATVEPTDISNPPEMMTNIMPNARIPLMDACFRMLTRLLGVMKLGLRMVSPMTMMIKITKIKYSLISDFRFFPLFSSSCFMSCSSRLCECYYQTSILDARVMISS